jgi:hypothetical protein
MEVVTLEDMGQTVDTEDSVVTLADMNRADTEDLEETSVVTLREEEDMAAAMVEILEEDMEVAISEAVMEETLAVISEDMAT